MNSLGGLCHYRGKSRVRNLTCRNLLSQKSVCTDPEPVRLTGKRTEKANNLNGYQAGTCTQCVQCTLIKRVSKNDYDINRRTHLILQTLHHASFQLDTHVCSVLVFCDLVCSWLTIIYQCWSCTENFGRCLKFGPLTCAGLTTLISCVLFDGNPPTPRPHPLANFTSTNR